MVVYKYTHMCINNTHTLVYCNSFWITSNSYNNAYVLYSCYKLLRKNHKKEVNMCSIQMQSFSNIFDPPLVKFMEAEPMGMEGG